MRKKTAEQISTEELHILSELQKHSIRDINEIAKNSNVSRQKIWKTIKKFEKNNIIWGYTTVVDEQKQNLQKFILLLKKTMTTVTEETVENITSSRLESLYLEFGITIESSHYLHGEYDWVLIFTAKDLRHAKKFSGMLLANYPGLIAKTNLLQIMYSQRLHYVVNPNKKKLKEFL